MPRAHVRGLVRIRPTVTIFPPQSLYSFRKPRSAASVHGLEQARRVQLYALILPDKKQLARHVER